MTKILIANNSAAYFILSSRKKCNDTCVEGIGESYKGVISKTVSGYTCQRWDSRDSTAIEISPDPILNRSFYPAFSTSPNDHNYCRNPDGDDNGPWCWIDTTNPNEKWEYCSQIPRCSSSNPGCGPKPTTTRRPTISPTIRPRTTWQPTTETTMSTTTLPSKQCGKNAQVLELGPSQFKLTKMDSKGY